MNREMFKSLVKAAHKLLRAGGIYRVQISRIYEVVAWEAGYPTWNHLSVDLDKLEPALAFAAVDRAIAKIKEEELNSPAGDGEVPENSTAPDPVPEVQAADMRTPVIRTQAEYRQAIAGLEKLEGADPQSAEGIFLAQLSKSVEDYEARCFNVKES